MGAAARYVILTMVSLGTVMLDQASKAHIMQTMRLHESIPVIPNFFSLTYIRNPGAAFGILASSSNGFRLLFFGFTSLFALALLGTIFFRLRIPRVLLAIMVGGSLASVGAALQALFRNPLAEPFTLGVSGGGAVGASVAIALGFGASVAGIPMVFLTAFLGSALFVALVYRLAASGAVV